MTEKHVSRAVLFLLLLVFAGAVFTFATLFGMFMEWLIPE